MLSQALDGNTISESDVSHLHGQKVIPDARHVLSPPDWIFFEDRAGLKAKFKTFLENNVIARPQGAWSAMEAAGVRILSKAVSSHLVECDEPSRDELVSRRIRERRLQLDRVLEGHVVGTHFSLSLLDQLQFLLARKLKIQFSLNAFNRELVSELESVPAHLKRQEAILYFVSRNGMTPWPSIARELALAICPDVEPGILAPGIKEVLVAETEDVARSILDELGFPPLEAAKFGEAPKPGYVGELGGQTTPEGVKPVPAAPEAGQELQPEGEPLLTPEEAVEHILGEGAPPPTAMPKERGRIQGKLRTYVTADGREQDKGEDPKRQEQREAVDQAGVNRVLAYERQAGRSPLEMPPKHPGYDVESKDGSGLVVRYIEVKSLSSEWSSLGVPLTRFQFGKSEELGERYWLYVVERAESDDFRIYPIQNPGRRVSQFIYDDGWRVLAETDDV